MADFTKALPFILSHEGTTFYHDLETGERSRYGITEKLLISFRYKVTDPNLLTIDDVNYIYANIFWTPLRLNEFISQPIANKLLDMAVNMGARQAVKLLQAALNMCGAQCVIDGIVGPHTVVTVNEYAVINGNGEKLLGELVLQSCSFYKRIAVGVNAKNLKGWLSRAEDTGLPQADKAAFSTLRDGNSDKVRKG